MEESCGEVNRLQVPVCDCGTVSTSSGQGDRFNSFREVHESFLCFPFSFFFVRKVRKKNIYAIATVFAYRCLIDVSRLWGRWPILIPDFFPTLKLSPGLFPIWIHNDSCCSMFQRHLHQPHLASAARCVSVSGCSPSVATCVVPAHAHHPASAACISSLHQ